MKLSVALVQLDATDDVECNIETAVALAQEAAEGARLVELPEYLQYRGSDSGFRASARPIPGPLTDPFADVARRRSVWILVGSTAETSSDPLRPYNTSTMIAPDGSIAVPTARSISSMSRWIAHRLTPSRQGSRQATGWSRPPSTVSSSASRSATTCGSRSSIDRLPWPAPRS